MEGHGPLGNKIRNYKRLVALQKAAAGFKLFYQRDVPLMCSIWTPTSTSSAISDDLLRQRPGNLSVAKESSKDLAAGRLGDLVDELEQADPLVARDAVGHECYELGLRNGFTVLACDEGFW